MAALPAIAQVVSLIGTGVSAYAQYSSGKVQEAQAEIEALNDEREGKAAKASAQRQAEQERRRAKIIRSRALAVAGASGAGVHGDPTIENILADIDTEGEVRARNALWEGDYLAQGLRNNARSRRNMGRAARSAGAVNAFSTSAAGLSDAGQSFYEKYG